MLCKISAVSTATLISGASFEQAVHIDCLFTVEAKLLTVQYTFFNHCESVQLTAGRFMEPRLKYGELAPEGLAKMRALEHYLNTGAGLEASLLELVRLRASLMNGCEFCINMHTAELKKRHEPAARVDGVAAWRSSEAYTKRERAALAWAEAVTDIQEGHAPDVVYEEVRAHFSDAEAVNLTLAITTINAWNRIAIALGAHSEHAGGGP